jgi:hypothetical protein
MKRDKDILQPFFEDLIYVSPDNQLPLYKLSKSDPPTAIKYMHAVGYQAVFLGHLDP